jgi:small subunit ribosomal protein S2
MASPAQLPELQIQDLLDAGLHFGHQTRRWNPKMDKYIYGAKNGVYIIDLAKTHSGLRNAQKFIYDTVAQGRQVLFVGTKRQAQGPIVEIAQRFNQPYVVNRWLGGLLTNNTTIQKGVARLKELERMDADGSLDKLESKKEASTLRREMSKLAKNLSGLSSMSRLPAALLVIDTVRESIAVKEANTLGIPVVGLVDTNADPEEVQYCIPGNDDGTRSVRLVVEFLGETIQHASNEYAKIAAEESRKRSIAEAEEAEKRKAVEAERKTRQEKEKKARAEAIKARKAEESKPADAAAPEAPAADATPTE